MLKEETRGLHPEHDDEERASAREDGVTATLESNCIGDRGFLRGLQCRRRRGRVSLASHSVGEGTAAARSAAGQGVAGVTRGLAGGPAREGAGACAHCNVGGRGGCVARNSAGRARQHAI